MTPPAPSWHTYDAISAVTAGVDEVAHEMETKWGVGRLVLLVDDDIRAKFNRQLRRFDEAIQSNDLERIQQTGAATRRAWVALDLAATIAGKPQLQPDVWEAHLEDGRVVVICRTNAEAHAEVRSGRHAEVWTLDEIARILVAYPGLGAPRVFPGGLVEPVESRQLVEPADESWA
jgi:hypothetical protein